MKDKINTSILASAATASVSWLC